MSKSLLTLVKFGGALAVLCSATTYNPSKASAQSLLPNINLLEGGQICLALCTSPRSAVTPSQMPPLSNSGLGTLPSQMLQLPQQILPPNPQAIRPNPSLPPNGALLPPQMPLQGNLPMPPQGNPTIPSPAMQPAPVQSSRPTFLQKIAPVLPQVIQQLSR